jgi:hypothetical protein
MAGNVHAGYTVYDVTDEEQEAVMNVLKQVVEAGGDNTVSMAGVLSWNVDIVYRYFKS